MKNNMISLKTLIGNLCISQDVKIVSYDLGEEEILYEGDSFLLYNDKSEKYELLLDCIVDVAFVEDNNVLTIIIDEYKDDKEGE